MIRYACPRCGCEIGLRIRRPLRHPPTCTCGRDDGKGRLRPVTMTEQTGPN